MKLQYKLLLVLILFIGLFFFSPKDSFGFVSESKYNIPSSIPAYNLFIDRIIDNSAYFIFEYTFYQNNQERHFLHICYIPSSYINRDYINFYFNRYFKNDDNSYAYRIIPLLSDSILGSLTNSYSSCVLECINGEYVYLNTGSFVFLESQLDFNSIKVHYNTFGATFLYDSETDIQIDIGTTIDGNVDKLNLYELNLTDLDYNNAVHQFNIATYTNSPCYDEIMEYYNKNYQYAIYVTDYRRTLTYGEPDNDDSFQYGSYNLSGYIDYIAHDKGVFYYDKSENQMKTGIYQTEATIKPTTEYTKRFYFNAVYSEDSNDPNMIVFEDNGNLGQTYNLSNVYSHFVGSSQTIYYCAENGTSNVATKGIVTRIDTVYYKGYLNPWGNIDKDKVRDISNVPFYVYNFKFAGGTTNLLFLNSPTYSNDISNIYNDLNEIHNNNEIVPDSSEGGSYIQGIDSTSSTYEPGKVTNDTTDEQDKEYEGGIRVPGVTTEDRSNWTIFDYVKNIFTTLLNLPKNIIQGISSLFGGGDGSSTASSITETTDTITNKFSFKDNMIDNANEIKDFISSTQATHKYYLNINHKYISGNVCIIDLSWYEPYKPTVDAFICAFAYLAFIWHMFCIVPNLIRGASAGSYVSDISTYTHTGTGRSLNIHKGGF